MIGSFPLFSYSFQQLERFELGSYNFKYNVKYPQMDPFYIK